MKKKILLLGSTGKMGLALNECFKGDYSVLGMHGSDFDAIDFDRVRGIVSENKPDIVINTVAFIGNDNCENNPLKAFQLNTLYPKFLAELSKNQGFLLVHFSTDAVFNNEKKDYYLESDCPAPLNAYGFTKYGGDCFIQAAARNYYIFRISILFGQATKKTQFVEKMLQKIKEGNTVLRISDDIIASPTYSSDVAGEVRRILEAELPSGLYHIVNEGKASLYELMQEIVKNLDLKVTLERASSRDFYSAAIKNTFSPLSSEKIPPLRPWKEAVIEYSKKIKEK